MKDMWKRGSLLLVALSLWVSAVSALEVSQAEWEAVKKDIEDLRKRPAASAPAAKGAVDRALEGKYGPNAPVTTKNGKLTISGLLQVWYYTIQNDHNGLFADNSVNDIADTNETSDNDSFRIRRTELKFTMDIHENVTAVITIDPAREAQSFPSFGSNTGVFKRINNFDADFKSIGKLNGGSTSAVGNVQSGAGAAPRMLQDAYINYHGVVPHHDFQAGQFKPFIGEEGIRSSAQLDFVERSMLGQLGDARDMGAAIHGTWWDDRFQYWLAAFNGAGNYLGSAGQFQNRSDDNDDKDMNARLLVRPVWKQEKWGSLELGYSVEGGRHGESGGADPVNTPVNGLNRSSSSAIRHDAWLYYAPGGPVKGLWLRGEWALIKDRNAPKSVIDLQGNGTTDKGMSQGNPAQMSVQGWYAAMGYKIGSSNFADSAPSWLKPFEFAGRFDRFQNVLTADLNNANHTDAFYTSVWTAGLNYYIKGHDAKIQMNYNLVENPESNNPNRVFHNVKNNNFVVNFQVAF